MVPYFFLKIFVWLYFVCGLLLFSCHYLLYTILLYLHFLKSFSFKKHFRRIIFSQYLIICSVASNNKVTLYIQIVDKCFISYLFLLLFFPRVTLVNVVIGTSGILAPIALTLPLTGWWLGGVSSLFKSSAALTHVLSQQHFRT